MPGSLARDGGRPGPGSPLPGRGIVIALRCAPDHQSRVHMAKEIAGGEPATQAAGIAVAVIIMISTVPSPLYALYQEQFGFSPLTLTLIFSVYVVGALLAMLFLGPLADQIGRRPMMMVAVVVSAVSAVAFTLVR